METSFDAFWFLYPRKVAKQAAMKAYKRALKLATPEQIEHGARCYARERTGQDVSYTKHPATWLNGGCWEDYALFKPIEAKANTPQSFYAEFGSQEIEAWDRYRRSKEGRSYPRDRRGGWHFPTRWPPDVTNTA